jgi:hypothetical protein
MKFTVTWVPDAEAELAELWMASPDRDSVRVAADRIDSQLRYNPQSAGESRAGGRRILIVPPIAVTYRVLAPDFLVQVLNVRGFSPR